MMDPYQENIPTEATGPSSDVAINQGVYPSQYRFSPDELRVLGECNRESFVQRSMPLATVGGVATYLAIMKGHLRPNSRFGPIPKVTLAIMAGYFIGKISYQQACAEKLMALPGSYIGQLLRERRDGKMTSGTPPKRQGPTMFGAKSSDIYSDAGPGNSLDLDTDRPLFSADDTYRTDNSETTPASATTDTSKRPVSYDDLRRKNRGEYSDSKQDPYRTDTAPMVVRSRPVPAPIPQLPQTNKYGDVIE